MGYMYISMIVNFLEMHRMAPVVLRNWELASAVRSERVSPCRLHMSNALARLSKVARWPLAAHHWSATHFLPLHVAFGLCRNGGAGVSGPGSRLRM